MAPPPFKVKAIYDYQSEHEDDLNFTEGQIVTVTAEEDDDWYVGEYTDPAGGRKSGLFPKNFVERYEPVMPPRPTRAKVQASQDTKESKEGAQPGSPTQQDHRLHQPTQGAPKQPSSFDSSTAVPSPVPRSPVTQPSGQPPSQEKRDLPNSPLSPRGSSLHQPDAPSDSHTDVSQPGANAGSSPPRVGAKPAEDGGPTKKPSVGPKPSFLERIAAFNDKTAAPLAPQSKPAGFKPVIQRQFVAPPPSRDAYLPVAPPDPHTPAPRHGETAPRAPIVQAEHPPVPPPAPISFESPSETGEDQPKPVSLKERIALLQQQQQQQQQQMAMRARHKQHDSVDKKKARSSVEGERHSIDSLGAPVADSGLDNHSRASLDEGHGQGDESQSGTAPSRANAGRVESHLGRAQGEEADNEDAEGGPDKHDEEEEEDDEIDPEVRRQMELRERMAKLSRGMGMPGMGMAMPGMFGIPTPSATKKKQKTSAEPAAEAPPPSARIPIMPGFGLPPVAPPTKYEPDEYAESPRSPRNRGVASPVSGSGANEENETDGHIRTDSSELSKASSLPPPPPPHAPALAHPAPSVQPANSPSSGSVSDDEMTATSRSHKAHISADNARERGSIDHGTPLSPSSSGWVQDPASPTSGTSNRLSKRMDVGSPPSILAPHPSVPAPDRPSLERTFGALSMDDGNEADCDTDDPNRGLNHPLPPPPPPPAPTAAPPVPGAAPRIPQAASPIPQTGAPPAPPSRPPVPLPPVPGHDADTDSEGSDVVMPMPHSAVKSPKQSVDMARPPIPTGSRPSQDGRRMSQLTASPSLPPPSPSSVDRRQSADVGGHAIPFPRSNPPPPPPPPMIPPPSAPSLPHGATFPLHSSGGTSEATSRPSFSADAQSRHVRKSSEAPRLSFEQGFIAHDLDLSPSSFWWIQPNGMPPCLQAHRDDVMIHLSGPEAIASSTGQPFHSRTISVLYQDYSQTRISVQYDPSNASEYYMEQAHQPPPIPPRPDILEDSHEKIGSLIAKEVEGHYKKGNMVGDGSALSLVNDLIRAQTLALGPVGSRSFGSVVYTNMANSSVSQADGIRPGDIITFRNAKFKIATMHGKSSLDLGREHIGIVREWDGTKKKVHVWEQGREKKSKVKDKSYRAGDLQTGEMKIWRVMPKSWVGWA